MGNCLSTKAAKKGASKPGNESSVGEQVSSDKDSPLSSNQATDPPVTAGVGYESLPDEPNDGIQYSPLGGTEDLATSPPSEKVDDGTTGAASGAASSTSTSSDRKIDTPQNDDGTVTESSSSGSSGTAESSSDSSSNSSSSSSDKSNDGDDSSSSSSSSDNDSDDDSSTSSDSSSSSSSSSSSDSSSTSSSEDEEESYLTVGKDEPVPDELVPDEPSLDIVPVENGNANTERALVVASVQTQGETRLVPRVTSTDIVPVETGKSEVDCRDIVPVRPRSFKVKKKGKSRNIESTATGTSVASQVSTKTQSTGGKSRGGLGAASEASVGSLASTKTQSTGERSHGKKSLASSRVTISSLASTKTQSTGGKSSRKSVMSEASVGSLALTKTRSSASGTASNSINSRNLFSSCTSDNTVWENESDLHQNEPLPLASQDEMSSSMRLMAPVCEGRGVVDAEVAMGSLSPSNLMRTSVETSSSQKGAKAGVEGESTSVQTSSTQPIGNEKELGCLLQQKEDSPSSSENEGRESPTPEVFMPQILRREQKLVPEDGEHIPPSNDQMMPPKADPKPPLPKTDFVPPSKSDPMSLPSTDPLLPEVLSREQKSTLWRFDDTEKPIETVKPDTPSQEKSPYASQKSPYASQKSPFASQHRSQKTRAERLREMKGNGVSMPEVLSREEKSTSQRMEGTNSGAGMPEILTREQKSKASNDVTNPPSEGMPEVLTREQKSKGLDDTSKSHHGGMHGIELLVSEMLSKEKQSSRNFEAVESGAPSPQLPSGKRDAPSWNTEKKAVIGSCPPKPQVSNEKKDANLWDNSEQKSVIASASYAVPYGGKQREIIHKPAPRRFTFDMDDDDESDENREAAVAEAPYQGSRFSPAYGQSSESGVGKTRVRSSREEQTVTDGKTKVTQSSSASVSSMSSRRSSYSFKRRSDKTSTDKAPTDTRIQAKQTHESVKSRAREEVQSRRYRAQKVVDQHTSRGRARNVSGNDRQLVPKESQLVPKESHSHALVASPVLKSGRYRVHGHQHGTGRRGEGKLIQSQSAVSRGETGTVGIWENQENTRSVTVVNQNRQPQYPSPANSETDAWKIVPHSSSRRRRASPSPLRQKRIQQAKKAINKSGTEN